MFVLQFITFVADRIRMGLGMLLPIFSDAKDSRNWNPWLRRLIHVILLGLVLWGLWYINKKWVWLQKNLLARAPEDIREYHLYLPIMFLVLYIACWVGYGLYKLFASEEEVSEFPDLERAWRTAVVELERVGIRLNDPEAAPPVFLVLGRPAAGMDSLFRAAGPDRKGQWKFEYRLPSDAGSRLVVYACYDPYSVYVTLPEATGYSYLCAALNGDTKYAPPLGSAEAADPTKTLSFDAGGGLQQLGLNASETRELRHLLRIQAEHGLTEVQQDRLEVLAAKGNRGFGGPAGGGGGGRPFSIRAEVLRTGERELRFVCSMIKRDRWPLCPINGQLVLIPWAAGETETVAQVAARELSANVAAVRDVFQLHFPTIAVVCDMDAARGFGQFRAGFKPDQLRARLGQRLPLIPVRTPDTPEVATLIRRGVQWIAGSIVPVWILQALQIESDAEREDGHDPNRELYLLLREVYRRIPGFAGILSRLPMARGGEDAEDLDSLPLLGGCYLAGTGDRTFRQAFVTGVFQRLADEQAAVAWTHRAYEEDQRFRRMTMIGYVLTGILAAVVGILALTS